MPFDQKHDLEAVKLTWTAWVQGQRPDLPNLQAVSDETKVPLSYLYKKTAKWKRELQATLQNALGQVGQVGRKAKTSPKVGSVQMRRLNASSPSGLALDLAPAFTDEYRQARSLGKQAMASAMQGLIDEATNGTGASRVSAIRELLDRVGLAKDKERKDEPSPYEDEGTEVLRARLEALLGKGVLNVAPSKISDPTTSQALVSTDPITPFPSLAQVSLSTDREGGLDPALPPIPVEQPPRGPRVLIT